MIIYLVIGGPDDFGRHTFWGLWAGYVGPTREEWGVRGQIFRANLKEHAGRSKADGRTVKVLNVAMMGGLTEDEAYEVCKRTIMAKYPTPASA